jgi:selenocysteine lyase/cysteine desulfurase
MTTLLTETPVQPCPDSIADDALLPVVGGELGAPLVTGGAVRYANLDYAASAPALQSVADHVATVLPYYASVHRGAGYASQVSTALYEGARLCVAAFVDAREDDVTVFTRNTTDSLNLLAGCVPDGGRVLLLDLEHHANLLPWQRCRHEVLPVAPTLEQTLTDVSAALGAEPTALLAITGASNVTGEEAPLDLLVTIAHAHGARVVVDAAQLAPHRRISLKQSRVDYIAFSGHKLYAPYGSGVLVGRRDWLDTGRPHLAGGGAVRSVAVDETEWAEAPQRHEAGSPNVIGATAIAAACQALSSLPEGALEVHEAALRNRLVAGLEAVDGVTVHRIWPDSPSSIGVVTFTVNGYDPGLVAAVLSAEHGIGVRDGKFCAHPLLARLGLASGAVRASVGVGTRLEDVDRLIGGLHALLDDGPAVEYAVVDGRWAPVSDTRPAPEFLTALATGVGTAGRAASPCQPA